MNSGLAVAVWPSLNPNVVLVSLGIFGTLAVGTVIRLVALRWARPDQVKPRLQSLLTWWLVALAVVAVALAGFTATVVLLTLVGIVALYEFLQLARASGPWAYTMVAFGCIPLHYLFVRMAWLDATFAALPVAAVVLLGTVSLLQQRVQDFSHVTSAAVWGLLVTAYLPSHAALLYTLPEPPNPLSSGAGYFLFLILATEGNDIAQATVGRLFGKRKLAPILSPRKTWEGFLGGLFVTIFLAMLIAAPLTNLSLGRAAAAGALIALAGSLGDLNISALKRGAGAKDSGFLLPGHGGILDRIDSLTFTAPTFYWFLRAVAY